jgi:hypothetical protein
MAKCFKRNFMPERKVLETELKKCEPENRLQTGNGEAKLGLKFTILNRNFMDGGQNRGKIPIKKMFR